MFKFFKKSKKSTTTKPKIIAKIKLSPKIESLAIYREIEIFENEQYLIGSIVAQNSKNYYVTVINF